MIPLAAPSYLAGRRRAAERMGAAGMVYSLRRHRTRKMLLLACGAQP